ncbi:MAG: hypothetical protein WCP77_23045 [Roseococcus sp.]
MIRRLLLALPLLAAIGAGSAHAQSCDTRFNFHNRSSTTVIEFYFDSSRNPNWTRDELGAGVLPAGQSKRFAAAYSGNYDFRAVLDGGRAVELRQVDICSITDVTLTDAGMTAR